MKSLLALLISLPLFAWASAPRIDLYRQIKKETGVSLKEAFAAVDKASRPASIDLQLYARKAGVKDIEQSFEEEISRRQEICERRKSPSCEQSVEDLSAQLEFMRKSFRDFDKLSEAKKLHFSLVVYLYKIKMKVLRADLEDWEKNCGSQSKINTRPCQDKLYETHVLADIATDIGRVALAKSEKVAVDAELVKSIKGKISRYEEM